MAASKLGARLVSLLAVSSLAFGCYSTTPHRVQVTTAAAPKQCADTISSVFARSGFVQLPTPSNVSMLFSSRLGGPYSSFMRTGTSVGVTIDPAGSANGLCHVTIEALSPDVTCFDAFGSLTCNGVNGVTTMNVVTGDQFLTPPAAAPTPNTLGPCPTTASLMCDLSYAPGDDNDAAVDELARRVRVALGPKAQVD